MAYTGAIQGAVGLLNQPNIKQGVKNIAGLFTFVFGLYGIRDTYKILFKNRRVSTEVDPGKELSWTDHAYKVAVFSAKISLILGAATSPLGKRAISSLVGRVFSPAQLERLFGPNTIFEKNPWHPRHVTSIAAVVLGLPLAAQSIYRTVAQGEEFPGRKIKVSLTDAKLRMMILFNTITSRPTLHIGNLLAHSFLRRA